MPKASEVAEISAAGTRYRTWKEVEVNRDYRQVVSEVRLTASEISKGASSWGNLRLKPGDPVEASLAGRKVAKGKVSVRQVGYDKDNHAVRFVVQSKVADLINGTVEAKPGEYKKQTIQQIGNAVLAPLGVGFRISGALAGADKIFPRVNVQIGESPFDLIERLCRMRNLHLIDDAEGNLLATRGNGGVVADLREGRNIKSAEMVWREDQAVGQITALGDHPGTDQSWGDDARGHSATATNSSYSGGHRALHLVAEHPGDTKDMQMRADHEVDANIGGMLTADITVYGWLRPDGTLWIEHVGEYVNVYSPMLFPQDRMKLGIQGVTHRQNDKVGTETTLHLVLPRALGSADKIESNGGPSSPDAATPDETNT
jgi:prophage tail gpP-like protein